MVSSLIITVLTILLAFIQIVNLTICIQPNSQKWLCDTALLYRFLYRSLCDKVTIIVMLLFAVRRQHDYGRPARDICQCARRFIVSVGRSLPLHFCQQPKEVRLMDFQDFICMVNYAMLTFLNF